MTWGWKPEPVTRLRPAQVPDGHGNLRPDYTNTSDAVVGAWLWGPSTSAQDTLTGREHGLNVAGSLYGPANADVAPGDLLEFSAGRFRLVGEPQAWAPGTVLEVERWDG